MTDADDDRLAQPDPDEVQLTDNSAGAPVDEHRLEEAEEQTRQQGGG